MCYIMLFTKYKLFSSIVYTQNSKTTDLNLGLKERSLRPVPKS